MRNRYQQDKLWSMQELTYLKRNVIFSVDTKILIAKCGSIFNDSSICLEDYQNDSKL